MEGYALQPWTTVRGVDKVTQDEEDWFDGEGFADCAIWLQVSDLSVPVGASLVLTVETAPTYDELLFTPIAAPVALTVSASPQVFTSVRTPSTSSLSRWLRWSLSLQGGVGSWSATFRAHVIPAHNLHFAPTDLTGCVLWLRSDLGVTVTSGQVSSWADQSGNGANASQGTGANQPGYSALGGTRGLPKLTQSGNQHMTGTCATSGQHTLFAVVRYPSPLGNRAAFAGTDAIFSVNSSFQQFTESPSGIIARACVSGVGFFNAITADTSTLNNANTPAIYTMRTDLTNTDLFVNGAQKATAALGGTCNPSSKYVLMALDTTPQYLLGGDAYEYILFNRALATDERIRIHRYLGGRYGIAVP